MKCSSTANNVYNYMTSNKNTNLLSKQFQSQRLLKYFYYYGQKIGVPKFNNLVILLLYVM